MRLKIGSNFSLAGFGCGQFTFALFSEFGEVGRDTGDGALDGRGKGGLAISLSRLCCCNKLFLFCRRGGFAIVIVIIAAVSLLLAALLGAGPLRRRRCCCCCRRLRGRG